VTAKEQSFKTTGRISVVSQPADAAKLDVIANTVDFPLVWWSS
jgi:hypothetical protein